ncbi:MAG: ABC1 kinase family protein [Planctomycetota bacterium]
MAVLRSIRTIRNIPRLKDISFVLLKHGLHDAATRLGAPLRTRVLGAWRGDRTPLTTPERLRLAFQELGPLFIKLGQLMASRPDLFPPPLVEEMGRLRSEVDPVPFPEIRAVIEQELGADPSTRFRSIEEEPLAAASIAQVHRAETLDGEAVIIKVQRPGTARIIDRDLEILGLVAEGLAGIPEFADLDPEGIAGELQRALARELNFHFERNAMERVRAAFEGDATIRIPRTWRELSTRRMLVMEYIEGTPLGRAELGVEEGSRTARDCARALFRMILRDGHFHADPHGGNLILMADGTVAWIDFGSMGLFTRELRRQLLRVLRAVVSRDYTTLSRLVLRLGHPRSEIDFFEFSQDMASRLDPYFGLTLQEIDFPRLLSELLDLARDHKISIAPGLILMTRCMVLVEGVGLRLDPRFNTAEELEPMLRKLVEQQLRPDRVVRDIGEHLADNLSAIAEYPQQVGEILRRVSQGQLRVDTHLQGLDQLGRRFESSSNRVVQALIVSSLLVSSSLVMDMGVGPQLWGVSGLGLAGYLFAGLIGVRILWGMLRN